ncbi:hypothetical protein [Paenibacillus sp. S150]|uniref:hypothetical protein n=1 Tax=Paenibacillus sp. S150 TaxID=2749826 RepID=UPI001C587B8F|nr:hypothetical protein [Paenibacillus sp. S150]MBW4081561.1 hypothetical protein [Paenibacillus sp. S150]
MVLFAVAFGMVLSTYIRTKEIQTDVQKIKEKLGIADEGEPVVSNEAIEAGLESAVVERSREDAGVAVRGNLISNVEAARKAIGDFSGMAGFREVKQRESGNFAAVYEGGECKCLRARGQASF